MPLLRPRFDLTVCPWTAENPRNDHQLIFPLTETRLLLVWSEYYANSPRLVERTPFDTIGGFADQAPCRITGKFSDDEGRTWSPRFTMQENLWGLNVKHPNLIRVSDTEILFTFTAWQSEQGERNVFQKRSLDNGQTWGEIVQISEPGWYCTNNDHALRLSSGRILLPSHGGPGFVYRGRKSKLHSFVFYSDDDGQTWRLSEDTMTAPGRGCHEPSIVELQDGRLLCFMRTTQERIYRSYSEDQGVHWTTPEPTELPAPDSPPLLKTIAGTTDLLLVWNHVASERNQPRTPLTAAISRDEGASWEHIQDVDNQEDHDSAYAAATFVGDEVLLTYYTRPDYWSRDTEVRLKIYSVGQLYGSG